MSFVGYVGLSLLVFVFSITSSQASQNCSTFSQQLFKPTLHRINCSIEDSAGQCNISDDYPVSEPQKLEVVPFTQDLNHQRVIYLNITWRPPDDETIMHLRAFQISYRCLKGSCGSRELFYCIGTPLTFNKHALATFVHQVSVVERALSPGDVIEVKVASLPHASRAQSSTDSRVVKIECSTLKNGEATSCLDIQVKDEICNDDRVLVKYNFPKFIVQRRLYIRGNYTLIKTLTENELEKSGKLEIFLDRNNASFHNGIEFDLSGSYKGRFSKRIATVNFTGCFLEPTETDANTTPVIIVVVCLAVLIAASIIFITKRNTLLVYLKICCPAWLDGCKDQHQFASSGAKNQVEECEKNRIEQTEDEEMPGRVKVLLVFVADHPKHRDVVLRLASYLQHDLGFQVVFELWQQDMIYQDSASWIEKAINTADKWVVIWSPQARKRWEEFAVTDCHKQDFFTPMLKKVKKDLFYDRNKEKYFMVHFDYCSNEDIPTVFRDMMFRSFKLMQDFKDLYAQLCDVPVYQPGMEMHEEKVEYSTYARPDTTKYGQALKQAVLCMAKIAKLDGQWHEYKEPPERLNSQPQTENDNNGDNQFNLENSIPVVPPSPVNGFTYNHLENDQENDHQVSNPLLETELDDTETASKPMSVDESFVSFELDGDCLSEPNSSLKEAQKHVKFCPDIRRYEFEISQSPGHGEAACKSSNVSDASLDFTDSFHSLEISQLSDDFSSYELKSAKDSVPTKIPEQKTPQRKCTAMSPNRRQHFDIQCSNRTTHAAEIVVNCKFPPNKQPTMSPTDHSLSTDSFQSVEISQFSDTLDPDSSEKVDEIVEDEFNPIEMSMEPNHLEISAPHHHAKNPSQDFQTSGKILRGEVEYSKPRQPCENTDQAIGVKLERQSSAGTGQRHPVENTVFQPIQLLPRDRMSIHPESFHTNDFKTIDTCADDAVVTEYPPVVIAPLDMEGNPWESLASINRL